MASKMSERSRFSSSTHDEIKTEPESADIHAQAQAPIKIKAELDPVDTLSARVEVKMEPASEVDIEITKDESCESVRLSEMESYNIHDMKFEIDEDGPIRPGLDTEMASKQEDGVRKVVGAAETSENDKRQQAEGSITTNRKQRESRRESTTRTAQGTHQFNVCQRRIRGVSNMVKHYRTPTGEKLFQCDACKKMFNQKRNLFTHIRYHTFTHKKLFQCNECECSFKRKRQLIAHIRIHPVEKPFQCKVCQKVFKEKYYLTKHIKTHTEEKPFQCDVCRKAFRERYVLLNHMRIHTREKPFQCELCEEAFSKRYVLSNHMRIHTGEKPYQCEMCQKAFSRRYALSNHMRIHTGEKPYQCEVCQKAFGLRSNLSKHKRTHTCEKPF